MLRLQSGGTKGSEPTVKYMLYEYEIPPFRSGNPGNLVTATLDHSFVQCTHTIRTQSNREGSQKSPIVWIQYFQGWVLQGTGTFCRVQNVSQNLQKFRVLCWKCYRTYRSFGYYRICYNSHRNFGYCTGSPTEAFVKIGYCVKVVQIAGGIVLEVLQNLQNFRVLGWKCYRYCAGSATKPTQGSGIVLKPSLIHI